MDYQQEYNRYWNSDDRLGTHSFQEPDSIVEEILSTCGTGPVLDVGCGMGALVRGFLSRGIRSNGVDVSQVAVNYCNQLAPGCFNSGSALDLPFPDASFDTVISTDCLEHLTEMDVPKALSEFYRVTKRFVYLRIATTQDRDNHWHLTVRQRDWWETQCFQAGFRKHPAYYRLNSYEALERDSWQIVVVLEKLPPDVCGRFSLDTLAAERDLHMDMLRETGRRSDAHIVRYALAAQYIRFGDTVLDAACGLGYGSHVMLNCSLAKKVIGIDDSEYAIRYATACFSSTANATEYRLGHLPDGLRNIPDSSVDFIASFETLEHVDDPQALLREFHRILTPSGRIVVSVPNDWADESGSDPNPYHLQVYTWERLIQEMQSQFLIDAAYAQTASQLKKGNRNERRWEQGGRVLRNILGRDIQSNSFPDCEWCILVAMRNPQEGSDVPYRETTYDTYPNYPNWNATAFARDYQNPWLVKGLVTIGHRLNNVLVLDDLSKSVLATAPLQSADHGAGLCVRGYRLLSLNDHVYEDVSIYASDCAAYLELLPGNPHHLRWQVSLSYLLGRLWQSVGNFQLARQWYKKCSDHEFGRFSPVLATKLLDSCLNLGFIELSCGDQHAAVEIWRKGLAIADQALHDDWRKAIGDFTVPIDFGLDELSAVLEKASSCAFALRYVECASTRPSQWWWQHQRDRLSQLDKIGHQVRQLESQSLELQHVHSTLLAKDGALEVQAEEIHRLNSVVVEKETAYHTVADELQRAHKTLLAKDGALEVQAEEIHRLNLAVVEKETAYHTVADELLRVHKTLQAKDGVIEVQGAELRRLTDVLTNVKEELLRSETELQAIRRTRWFRLRDVILNQTWGLKKVARVVHLIGVMATPSFIRRKLSPLVARLKEHRKLLQASLLSSPKENGAYVVRQPIHVSPNRLNVVHIIANFMTGGSSRLVVDLIEHLGSSYQQSVVTSYIPEPPAYVGLEITELRFPESERPFVDHFSRLKPDLLHVHFWGDCDEPWYSKAISAAEQLGIPVVENINTPIAPYISNVVRRYVYVSDYVRHVFGQNQSSHVTIHPGSDFSHFERMSHECLADDCIGMVYRLERDKLNENAIIPFIRVVQKRPKTCVLIVGGGSLLEPFRQAVAEAGLNDNFEFTGYVSYAELPDLYRRMSVFVAPVWKESFGQVSPFAMNMRVPVVGYDVGAIGEIVANRELLAEPENSEMLSEIIVRLLDSPEAREKLGDFQRKRAQDNFSVQAMIKAYDTIYRELTVERSRK